MPVTEPDPVTAAVAALIEHDATCSYCATAMPGDPWCAERIRLVAAAADPVTAAKTALAAHRKRCRTCGHGLPCRTRADLTAAWRKALRDASANHTPASVQTAEVPGDS